MTVNNKESVTFDQAKPFFAFDSSVYYRSDRLHFASARPFFFLFRRLCLGWSARRLMKVTEYEFGKGGGIKWRKRADGAEFSQP